MPVLHNQSGKHILLVEGLWSGHHPGYLKTFVSVLLREGYDVSALCPEPDVLQHWVQEQISHQAHHFQAYFFAEVKPSQLPLIPGRIRRFFAVMANWRQLSVSLQQLANKTQAPNLLFLMWADGFLNAYVPTAYLDSLVTVPWSGLYFHPSFLRKPGKSAFLYGNRIRCTPDRLIYNSHYAKSIAVLDKGIVDKLNNLIAPKPVFAFPDFTDEEGEKSDSDLVREIKLRANKRVIIGLLGGQAKRKGVLTLIKLARQEQLQDCFFVFAGELARKSFSKRELHEIDRTLSAGRENCFFYFTRIRENTEFNAVLKTCDVLYAVYTNFLHSSNVLGKAVIYNKSVLVAKCGGYMEETVTELGLGLAVPVHDETAISNALRELVSRPVDRQQYSKARHNYLVGQSKEQLKNVLNELLVESLESVNE